MWLTKAVRFAIFFKLSFNERDFFSKARTRQMSMPLPRTVGEIFNCEGFRRNRLELVEALRHLLVVFGV